MCSDGEAVVLREGCKLINRSGTRRRLLDIVIYISHMKISVTAKKLSLIALDPVSSPVTDQARLEASKLLSPGLCVGVQICVS